MFFRWTEDKKLYFFNDEKCGLKSAYQTLKAGNIDAAKAKSSDNLEFCKTAVDVKSKILAHALHNVGMMYFILGEYDTAIGYFEQANSIKPMSITMESAAECQRAKQLATQMQQLDERAEFAASTMPRATTSASQQSAGRPTPSQEQSIEERLGKLEKLYEKGLITQEEYEAKRAEILEAL